MENKKLGDGHKPIIILIITSKHSNYVRDDQILYF